MANTHNPQKAVVVTGDVTMDWHLARSRSSESGRLAWTAEGSTRTYQQRGGAALLADLIEVVAKHSHQSGQANYQVWQMATPTDPVVHSYALSVVNRVRLLNLDNLALI